MRPEAIRYLNRLSDLLFVLARVLARASGHGEVLWNHERRKAELGRSPDDMPRIYTPSTRLHSPHDPGPRHAERPARVLHAR